MIVSLSPGMQLCNFSPVFRVPVWKMAIGHTMCDVNGMCEKINCFARFLLRNNDKAHQAIHLLEFKV